MVAKVSYIPERGDLVWLAFDPQAGHEQAGRHPALICPVTSQVKGYHFEVPVPSGLAVRGVILPDQVKNLDWQVRRAEFICQLPDEATVQVLKRVGLLLKV